MSSKAQNFFVDEKHFAKYLLWQRFRNMSTFQVTGGPGEHSHPLGGTDSPTGQKQVGKSLKSPYHFIIFRKNATKPYSSLPGEAVFANTTGMLVVVFGLLVLYILQASSWKRPEVGITTERQVWSPGLPW